MAASVIALRERFFVVRFRLVFFGVWSVTASISDSSTATSGVLSKSQRVSESG